MDPITVAIAVALAQGLVQVGGKLLEKGVVEPTLEPATEGLKRLVQRGYQGAEEKKALLSAVQTAFREIGAPKEEDDVRRYLLNLGFDRLQAEGDAPLRQELARSVLLMTAPASDLIPDTLLRRLRWPSSRRQILADFLTALRRQLAKQDEWGALIAYADREAVREHLRALGVDLARTADAAERSAIYLRALLDSRGLAPDKPDTQALKEYVNHLLETHSHISFLFIKPAGRRSRVRTEAELETVFVPLQVQDPEAEERLRRRGAELRPEDLEQEAKRALPVTINEVLGRYPVFLLKGSPGSGKTTLLRHVTLCFARGQATERLGWADEPLLPILVPLRNFGRFLEDHRADYTSPAPGALRRFIEDYFAEYELELPPRFFRDRLQEGRCLVLLDGLDEVADRNLRATVAQMVNAFIQHYARRGNRFGLASRPKGYEEVADYLPRPVVCTVQPLTPQSRDELVTNLLKVLEPNVRRCREERRELLADIRAKSKVDELSRNPLFCTTMVLVYKYRGTTLPERRVDVYHELVELLLGFWETHRAEREGTADVRELVLMDGTGRSFMDERDAVEAKRRALTDLADWMQRRSLAEVPQTRVAARLARFFRRREGASRAEDGVWAYNFLAVAHQRSGLFIEIQPEIYAFSHQNFREYLAATALIEQLDSEMVQSVLAHADDPWWEEVILLAAAHPNLSDRRREFLLRQMLDAGHLLLAGRCAVDAGARLPAPLRYQLRDKLYTHMTNASRSPKERYAAGKVLDELGWLPEDLHTWVRCPGTAEDGGDLLVMKYPVTNAQFEHFIQAGGYENPACWGGEENEGWRWRVEEHNVEWRGEGPVTEPEYWHDPRFGKERRGYPLVGVSWYEATAYAAWLTDVLHRARAGDETLSEEDRILVADLLETDTTEVLLPTEREWERMAGGVADKDRYPWDPPRGPATRDEAPILARANTAEADLSGTSSVAMYPLGASQPFGLMDMAGNVWEWTNSWYDKDETIRVLRGGSWYDLRDLARCVERIGSYPVISDYDFGFRLVSPV
jgi:formylglycine-generating enzyme required for sulfatase activity